jgi:hypothetical protein
VESQSATDLLSDKQQKSKGPTPTSTATVLPVIIFISLSLHRQLALLVNFSHQPLTILISKIVDHTIRKLADYVTNNTLYNGLERVSRRSNFILLAIALEANNQSQVTSMGITR